MILRSIFFILVFVTAINASYSQASSSNQPTNVHGTLQIMSENFDMPQLNRTRKIWVYLPPDYYTNSTKKFPVLYMHDGQTLFDAKYAKTVKGKNEWRIDENLDSLYNYGLIESVIVVGIENDTTHRTNEYSPFVNTNKNAGGEGKKYGEFIVKTLKPYVDSNYRTLSDRKYTAVAGASFGGLITLYLMREYNNVFGMSAIFSPVIWFNMDILNYLSSKQETNSSRNYLIASQQEDAAMITNLTKAYQNLERTKNPSSKNLFRLAKKGTHDESFFQKEFALAFLWMFNPSSITGFDDFVDNESFRVFPNPGTTALNLKFNQKLGNIRVTDMLGRTVLAQNPDLKTEDVLDISSLKPGQYILTTDQGQRKVFIKR